MQKNKKKLSLIKMIIICLILVLLSGVGAMAVTTQVNTVKIQLANGYEMTVLTSKTNVKEILEDNNIILENNEKVTPNIDEEISEDKLIKITDKSNQEIEVAKVSESGIETSLETILGAYSQITEKIVEEEEAIPFETITKDVSNSSTETTDRVLQEGKEGIKEVTYKVKYQNDVEIEKKEISSKIIKKPVNKIVEVRNKQVTSRGGTTTRYGGKWTYSEAELDLLCAITAQEACSSYNAALAVITCAANRAESKRWRYNGTDPLSQYKARGQFCYSIDNHWRRRLNGNYPSYVKQAVIDALNGKRNHNYLSFRSAGYASGVNIGGNVYFNAM